ncbi:MAG: glycosyltransferase family 2 protein [Nitrososphaera sp.]|nr:glycosyltransferase family 2 protein [Nitrososphaera sp.]
MNITSVDHLLKLLLPTKWKHKIREQIVSLHVTHLCGPKTIQLSNNEAIVTCVVKNGEFYIESFIEHYSQMGFRHIFFLDNGSSDQTVSIAKRHKNVSVWECKLPIDTHQRLFKKYLAQKSAPGAWCLDADIDEFFDYPFSEVVGLGKFLEYLNKKQFTAAITQLLDMFSDRPLSHLEKTQDRNLKAVYQFYDISDVTKIDYCQSEIAAKYGYGNEISNGNAGLNFGGIRKTLYRNNCLLTKHSLFLPGKGLQLFPNVHFVNNAKLADLSCVMLHYKLTSNALNIALQNKEGFLANSKGYTDFLDFLINKPDYQIKQKTAIKFRTADALVDSGFLFMSEQYREYIRALAR